MSVPGAIILSRGNNNTELRPYPASCNSIPLYWSAPADNGSPILGYTISNNSPPMLCNVLFSPALITGLTAGIPYSFSIAASNANGYGPWTPYRDLIVPGLKPGPPQNVTITNSGLNAALVSWSPPSYDSASPVKWYVINAISQTPGDATIKNSALGHINNRLLRGFNPSSLYRVNVYAVNDPGYSVPVSVTKTAAYNYVVRFLPSSFNNTTKIWTNLGNLGTPSFYDATVESGSFARLNATNNAVILSNNTTMKFANFCSSGAGHIGYIENFTCIIWYNRLAAPPTEPGSILSQVLVTGSTSFINIWDTAGSPTFRGPFSFLTGIYTTNTFNNNSGWTMCTATYSNSSPYDLKSYSNNSSTNYTSVGTGFVNQNKNTNATDYFRIGAHWQNPNSVISINGQIGELSIINRVLSPPEISNYFASTKSSFGFI